MRNRVSHGYDKVDLKIVWKTIGRDLPRLREQVATVRSTLIDRQARDGADS